MASEVCSHVKVVVRLRPFSEKEKSQNLRQVVHVVDNHMLIFDPIEKDIQSFGPRIHRNRDLNKKANKDLTFVFDNVFGEDSTQVDIFENTTKEVLDGVLNGFNCTVFAYGATGAGKTHTMLGSSADPGVMYRTMKELFSRMDGLKDDKEFDMVFSYLEVYNEQIRDLLANKGPLAVREDSLKGVVIQDLTLHKPKSAEHLLEALDYGNRNRTQHPTDMNATSSRSHAVFQIYLRQQDRTASLHPNVRMAKLSLIDLAGSERASATNARGARQREGANINRSLLALGNVINALADPKQRRKGFIPYRDSKLTRLLKDSLGGNCRTVMIANISPSSTSYDDTHNTLKYANRAKEIKSSLKRNVVSLDSHIGQYAVICERQRQEILQLKQKLKEYEEQPVASGVSSQNLAEIQKVSCSLQSVFSGRAQVRREQLGLERQLKENELRQAHSREASLQAQLLCSDDQTSKATGKHERRLASLRTQQQHLRSRLAQAHARFLDNDGWLHRLENAMKMLGEEGTAPEALQKELQCQRLQLQVEDLKQHIAGMAHLISLQDQETRQTKKLVTLLLPAYSRLYGTLRGAGLVAPDDEAERQEVEQLVRREKGVAWADQERAEEAQAEEGPRPPRAELPPLLSFSRLLHPHSSSPCSTETQNRRASLRLRASPSSRGPGGDEPAQKKPTRRRLSVSPAPPSSSGAGPPPAGPAPPPAPTALQDVLRQEGMFPLQYTPEPPRDHPSSPPGGPPNDSNTTFEILDWNDATTANATIVLGGGTPTGPGAGPSSCPSGPGLPQPSRASDSSRAANGLGIPSLLDSRRSKPLYMAMTSAAHGKRKLSCIREEAVQGLTAPKRIKRDPSAPTKPLRVRRLTRSSENEPRRVGKTSEGTFLQALKPKAQFLYKPSQQLLRAGSSGHVTLT